MAEEKKGGKIQSPGIDWADEEFSDEEDEELEDDVA
jgi:hypothetical protein